MVSLYDLILDELQYRRVVHYDRFGTFYAISIACHLFNLYNKGEYCYATYGEDPPPVPGRELLMIGSKIFDTRLHTMFVAPPGFGKTYFIEHFIEGKYALLPSIIRDERGESGFPFKLVGSCSGAGFVGTIRQGSTEISETGDPFARGVITKGLAQRYSTGFLGADEFSDLTEMMKRRHSRELDTAMLRALDSGIMEKDLAAGEVAYRTGVTLWGGTQPERFDMSSGLARRLIFLRFTPTRQDMEDIRWSLRRALRMKYTKYDKKTKKTEVPMRVINIRNGINKLKKMIEDIDRVYLHGELDRFIDELREQNEIEIPHTEEIPLHRIILGYWLINQDLGEKIRGKFILRLNKKLKSILEQEVLWRMSIKKGGEFGEIEMILAEHYQDWKRLEAGIYRGMPIRELQYELLNFGLDLIRSRKRIYGFEKTGEIYFTWKAGKGKKQVDCVVLTRTDNPKCSLSDILSGTQD